MSVSAQLHQIGRRFTGITLGRRGSALFGRIYDKTVESPDGAPIHEVWREAGYEPAEHGDTVWRVEFEVRSAFLRTIATRDGHIGADPGVVLNDHLDDIWAHLMTEWLVLRQDTPARTRIERRPPAVWWAALGRKRGLNGAAFGPERQLTRRPRPSHDTSRLFSQAAGVLATVAAINGITSLQDSLACFSRYLDEALGEQGFTLKIRRAEERQRAARPT